MHSGTRLAASLAILTSLCAGCWSNNTYQTPEGGYHTIQVKPGRDTAAAMQANREGLEHLDRGELTQAENSFKKALSADVDFGPAHNNLGLVYVKRGGGGDLHKAAWEFDNACKLLPSYAEPHNNLALVWEESGNLEKAVEQYREAVRLNGRDVSYRGNLARAMVKRGDRGEELRALLQTLVEQDGRAEWQEWAKRQLAILGAKAASAPSGE